MRLSNVAGRVCIERDGQMYDVEAVSRGQFGPDPQAVYEDWDTFLNWAQHVEVAVEVPPTPVERAQLECPVPRPRQIFAVGLNYAEHAEESGFEKPVHAVIFTKFASSLDGPFKQVSLPHGSVDWEVELVVAVGRGGRNIAVETAWEHVAGVSVGQDLSERELQHSGPAPQFSLAKSYAGFSPFGPQLVTLDEISDPDDLRLGCSINGETVQDGTTKDLIFPIPELIAQLSCVVELFPGDVIFTGTPSGVGAGRKPPRFLQPGDVLTSWISGIGEIEQHLTSGS